MKIRNRIFNSLMLVMLAVLSIGLTACGDDDDNEPEIPAAATWSTAYAINVTFGPDMFRMADITAHIVKPDGTVSEETVLQEKYTLTMTGNGIPDKAGVLFTFVPKSNVDPEEVYQVMLERSVRATSYKNGEVFSNYSPSTLRTSMSIKGSQVDKYFTGKGVAVTVGINADGYGVTVDSDEFDFGVNSVWEWLAGVLADNGK